MRAFFLLIILIGVAILAWQIASVISPDAVSMAVGMLFGVMAGIPAALLAMAGNRRSYRDDDYEPPARYTYNDNSTHNHLHTSARDSQSLPALPGSQRQQYLYKPVDDSEEEVW